MCRQGPDADFTEIRRSVNKFLGSPQAAKNESKKKQIRLRARVLIDVAFITLRNNLVALLETLYTGNGIVRLGAWFGPELVIGEYVV